LGVRAIESDLKRATGVYFASLFELGTSCSWQLVIPQPDPADAAKENMFPPVLNDKEKAMSDGNALSVRMSWIKVCVRVFVRR
jgi:hypothetical protein